MLTVPKWICSSSGWTLIGAIQLEFHRTRAIHGASMQSPHRDAQLKRYRSRNGVIFSTKPSQIHTPTKILWTLVGSQKLVFWGAGANLKPKKYIWGAVEQITFSQILAQHLCSDLPIWGRESPFRNLNYFLGSCIWELIKTKIKTFALPPIE